MHSLCARIDERLPYYYEDELASYLRQEVKEHLGECPDCKRRYKYLKETTSLLRRLDRDSIKAPAWIVDSVMQRVSVARPNIERKISSVVYVAGAAVIAAIVLGILRASYFNQLTNRRGEYGKEKGFAGPTLL